MTHKDRFTKETPEQKSIWKQFGEFSNKFIVILMYIIMLPIGYFMSKEMGYEVYVMMGIMASALILIPIIASFFERKSMIPKGYRVINLLIALAVGYYFYTLGIDYRDNHKEYDIVEFNSDHLTIAKNYTLLCDSCNNIITEKTENSFCGDCGNKYDTIYDGKVLIYKEMNRILISDSIVNFDESHPLKFYTKYKTSPICKDCKTSLLTETLIKSDLMDDYVGISTFYDGYNYKGIVNFDQ